MKTWVYDILKKKGLTQKALAEKLGISPRTLCNKFSGKQPFLYDEVKKICEILGIENPLNYDW